MRKRVLVVAQDTALRARIARLLQPAGYAVELSASEKRALELSVNHAIDTAIVVTGAGVGSIAFARQLSDRVAKLIVLTERLQFVPGRDPEGIKLFEIFDAVRALHGGRLGVAIRPVGPAVALLNETESAMRAPLKAQSLKDLIADASLAGDGHLLK